MGEPREDIPPMRPVDESVHVGKPREPRSARDRVTTIVVVAAGLATGALLDFPWWAYLGVGVVLAVIATAWQSRTPRRTRHRP